MCIFATLVPEAKSQWKISNRQSQHSIYTIQPKTQLWTLTWVSTQIHKHLFVLLFSCYEYSTTLMKQRDVHFLCICRTAIIYDWSAHNCLCQYKTQHLCDTKLYVYATPIVRQLFFFVCLRRSSWRCGHVILFALVLAKIKYFPFIYQQKRNIFQCEMLCRLQYHQNGNQYNLQQSIKRFTMIFHAILLGGRCWVQRSNAFFRSFVYLNTQRSPNTNNWFFFSAKLTLRKFQLNDACSNDDTHIDSLSHDFWPFVDWTNVCWRPCSLDGIKRPLFSSFSLVRSGDVTGWLHFYAIKCRRTHSNNYRIDVY